VVGVPERVDKFAARRAELAEATLKTLAELGYARTSLREIAQNSEYSHGVLHYYFQDKAVCVTRYDQVVATATTPQELRDGFLDKLGQTLVDEAHMHRLWYDLRNQSMFEPSFRADVAAIDASLERMVWRVVSRFAELVGTTPQVGPSVMYALFDGLFQQALVRQLAGEPGAVADLRAGVAAVVGQVVPADGAVVGR
jgi:AcrR family transcriptional regulator